MYLGSYQKRKEYWLLSTTLATKINGIGNAGAWLDNNFSKIIRMNVAIERV